MKNTNNYQCCYCKNNGNNPEDFHNIQPSSTVIEGEYIVQRHITYGCNVCKAVADSIAQKKVLNVL